MTDSLPEPPQLDPAALAGTSFSRGRRGFDSAEVNSAIGRAADALRTWELRDRQLTARIELLESRLNESRELDEGRIASVLGEETARIITTAREAAGEIRSKAEEDAARLLKETEDAGTARAQALESEAQALRNEAQLLRDNAASEAERLINEATESSTSTVQAAEAKRDEMLSTAQELHDELLATGQSRHDELVEAGQARHDELIAAAASILEERTAEADLAAAELVAKGTETLASAEENARITLEAAARDSEASLDVARNVGRSMVAEAKEVRERILADLAERRRIARQQIEAARAGRDAIIDLLRAAGQEMAGTVDGLVESDGAVQSSAEAAVGSLEDDSDLFLAELDIELGVDHFELVDREVIDEAAQADEPAAEDLAVDVLPADGPVAEGVLIEAPQAEDEAVETPVQASAAEDAPADEAVAEPDEIAEVVVGTAAEVAEPEVAQAEGGRPELVSEEDLESVEFVELAEVETSNVVGIFDNAASAETSADHDVTEDPYDSDEDLDDLEDEEPDEGDVAEVDLTVDSSGATVHDLFARIRAEGIDVPSEPAPPATVPATADAPSTTAAGEATEVAASAVALDDLSAVLDRRDSLVTPVEKQLLRSLRRLASDEQNETLDRLRRVKRGRPELEAVLAGVDESTARFTEVLMDDFSEAVEAGVSFWVHLTGTSADPLFDDSGRTHERLESMVSEFISVHRARLERAFSDAEKIGLDTAELGDSLSAAYREWRSNSLSELAGDLATAGFAHGERTAAGPGTPWRWVVDNGGLPCADGEDNALAGAVACEEPFPTGDITPPAHAGCRCLLVPAHQ